ncbi:hypothetical protein CRYUN_Cryun17cG0127400 [Craigia yunnanensis]
MGIAYLKIIVSEFKPSPTRKKKNSTRLYGSGNWTTDSRKRYILADAISRHTVQVYPRSWTAVLVSLDNKGMWNLRSQSWSERYLGKQLYLRVWNDENSLLTETDIPPNALRCGKAVHL